MNVDSIFMKVDNTCDGTVNWVFNYIFSYSNALPVKFIICKDVSHDILRLLKN